MKRVLLLSTVHPAADPRIVHKIAPTLAEKYEVTCMLPGLKNHANPAISCISLPAFERLALRLLFSHPLVCWHCIRCRPHIVHIFVPELIPVGFILQFFGAKVIYEVQENLFKKFPIKRYNNSWLFRRLFSWFDHLSRKNFHFIFTDLGYLSEYQHLKYPHEIVQNFADLAWTDLFTSISKSVGTPPELFYIGVISLERSFDVMVKAFAELKTVQPDFVVHLFGPVRLSAHERNNLPGFAEIAQNLKFYGYTSQEIAFRYAAKCIAGIALLKPVADYPESFTTKLFEYMALGLPVITSDFPVYQNIIGLAQCGFCISPFDSNSLAAKLKLLSADPEMADSMGINGKNFVKKFHNWNTEAQKLLAYYNNIGNTQSVKL